MKVINLSKPKIIIPFEDNGKPLFELHVDRSDETLLKIGQIQKDLEEKSNTLIDKAQFQHANEAELIEEAKEIQRHAYDTLLGEGAFNQVYGVIGSVEEMSAVLLTICEGIANEIKSERAKVDQRMQKYLKK